MNKIKLLFVTLLLGTILLLSFNVKASSNEVWIMVDEKMRIYEKDGKYGSLELQVTNYKLNDFYNQDSTYDYFAVKAVAYLNLFEQYREEVKKFFGGIKYLWLNAGIEIKCYIDGYEEGNLELVSYSPSTQFNDVTYNTSVGINLGFSGRDLQAGINAAFGESYTTNFKKIINNSSMTDEIVDIDFVYEGFYIHDIPNYQYLMNAPVTGTVGVLLLSLEDGTVRHIDDSYQTFQQEVSDSVVFVYRRPKSVTGGFPLNVFCYGRQLYIDYDWKNSHDFDEIMLSTGMMTIA